MLYDYLIQNFETGEPILIEEIPGSSRDYVRQEMKKLTDEGRIERLHNGVYYLAYTTILGTRGRVSFDKYLEKKYLYVNGQVSGYITGLQLANNYGFSTQVPSCYEICSNKATTRQRKTEVDGRKIVIYQPAAPVTVKNRPSLQFLDLMSEIDKYSEISGDELKQQLRNFARTISLDFEDVRKYLPLYPDRVYRNLYRGGMMSELV